MGPVGPVSMIEKISTVDTTSSSNIQIFMGNTDIIASRLAADNATIPIADIAGRLPHVIGQAVRAIEPTRLLDLELHVGIAQQQMLPRQTGSARSPQRFIARLAEIHKQHKIKLHRLTDRGKFLHDQGQGLVARAGVANDRTINIGQQRSHAALNTRRFIFHDRIPHDIHHVQWLTMKIDTAITMKKTMNKSANQYQSLSPCATASILTPLLEHDHITETPADPGVYSLLELTTGFAPVQCPASRDPDQTHAMQTH